MLMTVFALIACTHLTIRLVSLILAVIAVVMG